jgi:hypothetical protein
VLGPPRPRQRFLSQQPRAAPASSSVCDVKPTFCAATVAPEGSRMLSYLCICVACYRTCVHSRCARYARQPSGAGPCLSIWLAAPRGPADIYVCVVMFWSYLTITGNAPLGHSHLFTSSIYLWFSCFPLAVSCAHD